MAILLADPPSSIKPGLFPFVEYEKNDPEYEFWINNEIAKIIRKVLFILSPN